MKLRMGLVWLLTLWAGAAQADGWSPGQASIRYANWLVQGTGVERLIAAQAPSGLGQLSRDQLLPERRRLEDEMPGLGGPIAITCVGGGVLLVGSLYLFLGLGQSAGFSSGGFVTLGVIGMVGGVIGCVAGIIWLLARMADREPLQEQLKEIDQRLNQIYNRGPAPAEDYPPPPPPPPPPAVLGPTPPPMLMVARF